MRGIITLLLFAISSISLHAQEAVSAMGINLEGIYYGYPSQVFEFESQGQPMEMSYIYAEADNGNGQTVMLLHGKNFNGAYWKQTIDVLLAEGYDVVAPDQIGFGKSTKPDYYMYSFQQLASNTKMLLDEIGVKETIVLGHSMGGMLATRFALMYPDVSEQLVLLNPIGLEDWKLWVPYQTIDDWYQRELGKTYEGVKNYQMESYYDGQWKDAYDPWVEYLVGPTYSPDYPRLAWNNALTYDMVFTQPVVYEFGDLQMPTLLIIGQRDRTALGKNKVDKEVAAKMGNYPALGKRTTEIIPEAKLIELDGLGHLPHIENFDLFIKSLVPNLLK